MDLKIPWKALSKEGEASSKRDGFSSKWGAFSVKQIAFFAIIGLALVAGIVLRFGPFFGQPDVEQNAPVTVAAPPPPHAATPLLETTESPIKTPPPAQQTATPNEQPGKTDATVEQTEQANGTVDNAEQSGLLASGTILVSKQPIGLLASPSSSAPTLYGFPAGRPFRVIGHNGGFAQIQDLRSSASGWIDEAALAPPPGSPPVSSPSRSSQPSQSKPVAVNRSSTGPLAVSKPKATKKDGQVAADSEEASDPVQTTKRPGLFGGGGLFGGIFGNGNGN
jgi:hypothetical protein